MGEVYMIKIKHRHTGTTIKEVDDTSLVNANLEGVNLQDAYLRDTDLRNANLQFADLQGADLQGADLRLADLQYAILQDTNLKDTNLQNTNLRWVLGDGKRIKTTIDRYRIVIMQEYGVMAIGCKQYSIDKWMNFSNAEISKMDAGALQWWKEWKPRIQQLIAG
jgi:uncharacterized protein YjbI with pentapeptide repeats